ncbi:hypothetical protein, partial [Salmonella enterica]|uniref:hypothetical protein n=1 Tax=Salmonella enterica TaxID=28901 RepID=UPI003299AF38
VEKTRKLSIEQKQDYIKKSLADEGCMIEGEKNDEGYLINEISCPYFHIGDIHVDFLILDDSLISSILFSYSEK